MSKWTPDEDALLAKYDNATVAKITGRSLNAIKGRRATLSGRHDSLLKAYYCYQCGKEFFPAMPEKWAYRRTDKRIRMFCSWHCMRAYDNGKPREKKTAE